jgi:hypothetical protein
MIPIYKSEIDAGLEQKIRTSASFGILANPIPYEPSVEQKELIQKRVVAEANPNQFDLFYVQSLLVSVGWNKNHDVFAKAETWKARSTPIDKPVNYQHNSGDIIGHLTSAVVLDREGNVISNDAPFDDVPDDFDIIVGSVLYRSWSDKDLQERMDQIIVDIPSGKWKVSMECLFRDFDYAIVGPNDEHHIVKRDSSTAFLTKHLKQYGGSGEYEDHKIGRLLREFAFSGKGLVEKPANPRSNILDYSDNHEVNFFASTSEMDAYDFTQADEDKKVMSEVTYTQEQYTFLKDESDELKAKAIEKDNRIIELEQETASLKADRDQAQANAEKALNDANVSKDEEITELKKQLEEVTASRDELQGKLGDMEAQATQAARLAQILERDIDKDRAQALVDKFAGVSDEMFTELIQALPEKIEVNDDASDDDKDGLDPDHQAAADADDIEGVEDDDLQDKDQTQGVEKRDELADVCEATAAWLGDSVLRSTAKLTDKK